ncbi:MAG: transcriptional regulator [Chloroflexi bacterium HGW-Chloroflexi-1]|nr:MAG: transcriptional regulator [Chloroflexi bacterium HGW-Chloroflexi-1]
MFSAGDIVLADFPGAMGTKRRPTVVISSGEYHRHRPDIIVGVLTTQIAKASAPTDYVLQDWAASGPDYPCAFRSYPGTLSAASAELIGRCSERDWREIKARLLRALAV